jgi:hypothetical protein
MQVERVTRIVAGSRKNPARASRTVARRSQGNPAHLLSLGWVANPKGGRTMAKKRNSKKAKRNTTGTRVIVMGPRKNGKKGKRNSHRRRGSRNPAFFGSSTTPMQMTQYVVAGLVGVTVNRVAIPLMPASITSNNWAASLTAFVIAGAEWWLVGMVDKNLGSAVGFGALMNAATYAMNAFIPSVGSQIGLRGVGRRGTGDFVDGAFTVPQNPVVTSGVAGNGPSIRSAYPSAYALAA